MRRCPAGESGCIELVAGGTSKHEALGADRAFGPPFEGPRHIVLSGVRTAAITHSASPAGG